MSSTVVGHFKTCSIIVLGWIYSGKSVKDASLLGIVLAVGGIISYDIPSAHIIGNIETDAVTDTLL